MNNKTLFSTLVILGLVATIGVYGCKKSEEAPNVNVNTEVTQPANEVAPANEAAAPVNEAAAPATEEAAPANEAAAPATEEAAPEHEAAPAPEHE